MSDIEQALLEQFNINYSYVRLFEMPCDFVKNAENGSVDWNNFLSTPEPDRYSCVTKSSLQLTKSRVSELEYNEPEEAEPPDFDDNLEIYDNSVPQLDVTVNQTSERNESDNEDEPSFFDNDDVKDDIACAAVQSEESSEQPTQPTSVDLIGTLLKQYNIPNSYVRLFEIPRDFVTNAGKGGVNWRNFFSKPEPDRYSSSTTDARQLQAPSTQEPYRYSSVTEVSPHLTKPRERNVADQNHEEAKIHSCKTTSIEQEPIRLKINIRELREKCSNIAAGNCAKLIPPPIETKNYMPSILNEQQNQSFAYEEQPVSNESLLTNQTQNSSSGIDENLLKQYNIKDSTVRLFKMPHNFITHAKKGTIDWNKFFSTLEPGRYSCIKKSIKQSRKRHASEIEEDPEYREEEPSDFDNDDEKDEDFDVGPQSKKRRKIGTETTSLKERMIKVRMYECESCTFSTTSKKLLFMHSAHHKNPKESITCEHCGALSISQADHNKHLYEAHFGPSELPRIIVYICKKCNLKFTNFIDLQNHNSHHFDVINSAWNCQICSRTFNKYASFLEHTKTHIDYKCTFCESHYSHLGAIERHCAQAHSDYGRPFQCYLCTPNSIFKTAVFGLFVEHREERHGLQRLDNLVERCKFCLNEEVLFDPSNPRCETVDYETEIAIHQATVHVDVSLYSCALCHFGSNDMNTLGQHALNCAYENDESEVVNVSEQVAIQIEGPDLDTLNQKIQYFIKHKFSSRAHRHSCRGKPTFTETQDAIAALLGADPSLESLDESAIAAGSLE